MLGSICAFECVEWVDFVTPIDDFSAAALIIRSDLLSEAFFEILVTSGFSSFIAGAAERSENILESVSINVDLTDT